MAMKPSQRLLALHLLASNSDPSRRDRERWDLHLLEMIRSHEARLRALEERASREDRERSEWI